MIYIVAFDQGQGDYYRKHIADPPLGQHETVVMSTSTLVGSKAKNITDDDTIVYYGDYEGGKHWPEVSAILASMRSHSNPKEVWV